MFRWQICFKNESRHAVHSNRSLSLSLSAFLRRAQIETRQMGSRLGRQKETILFRHNDVMHLDATLASLRARNADPIPTSSSPTNTNIFVAVESVYSMDGDLAPLKEILRVAGAHGAMVIIDEAHG